MRLDRVAPATNLLVFSAVCLLAACGGQPANSTQGADPSDDDGAADSLVDRDVTYFATSTEQASIGQTINGTLSASDDGSRVVIEGPEYAIKGPNIRVSISATGVDWWTSVVSFRFVQKNADGTTTDPIGLVYTCPNKRTPLEYYQNLSIANDGSVAGRGYVHCDRTFIDGDSFEKFSSTLANAEGTFYVRPVPAEDPGNISGTFNFQIKVDAT